MNLLTDKQYQLMDMLLRAPQGNIKKVLKHYLKERYKEVIETERYIIAKGDIPIALAAHMDTVFESEIQCLSVRRECELLYDRQKNIMHCVGYGGFDDKAGIFAILQIVQTGLRPHIIFSTDEEKGCLGAKVLASQPCPFKDLRYIIQLDRRGIRDCVFYDLDTEKCKNFVDYVESFGFVEAYGTFTDITEYCPEWGVAGVNLSVGYFNEHTHSEVLYVDPLLATIKKVICMLRQENIPQFPYIEQIYSYYNWKSLYGFYDDKSVNGPGPAKAGAYTCSHCNQKGFLEAEIFPVVGLDTTTKFFCPSCLSGRVNWCVKCWEAYEIDPEIEVEDQNYVCEYCSGNRKD